jgi:two-component system, chemotaxis family, protein-glutamate methylesterase/glutaminase
MLWQVMRSLEEAVMLLDHMGRHAEEAGDAKRANAYSSKARDLERRSKLMHDAVKNQESLSGENIVGRI